MRQDVIIDRAFTASYKTHSMGQKLKNQPPYENYEKMDPQRRRRNGDKIRVEGT